MQKYVAQGKWFLLQTKTKRFWNHVGSKTFFWWTIQDLNL